MAELSRTLFNKIVFDYLALPYYVLLSIIYFSLKLLGILVFSSLLNKTQQDVWGSYISIYTRNGK